MAKVMFQVGEDTMVWDMSTEPLTILLIKEGDATGAEEYEAFLKSAGAVTKVTEIQNT